MLVSDILRRKGGDVVSAPPTLTVAEAARLLAEKGIGSLLVLENSAVAGILSERDIVRAVAREGAACLGRPIAALMTAKVVTGRPDQPVDGVREIMTNGRFRHLPIVDAKGRLCGIVSIGDVVKHRLEESQAEVEQMAAYVRG